MIGHFCSFTIGLAIALACPSLVQADGGKRLKVGDRAIDFDLPIADDEGYLSLRDEYKQGPIVLIVLRGFPGYQCPVCTQHFSSLANRSKALSAETHRVILVYPGEDGVLEKRAREFMGTRRLPQPLVIVRDDGMQMVEEWGLRWRARKETAYPATYVIDRNGRIRWQQISKSHAGRSSVQDILKELRKL
jgi:peroxiredoxin